MSRCRSRAEISSSSSAGRAGHRPVEMMNGAYVDRIQAPSGQQGRTMPHRSIRASGYAGIRPGEGDAATAAFARMMVPTGSAACDSQRVPKQVWWPRCTALGGDAQISEIGVQTKVATFSRYRRHVPQRGVDGAVLDSEVPLDKIVVGKISTIWRFSHQRFNVAPRTTFLKSSSSAKNRRSCRSECRPENGHLPE